MAEGLDARRAAVAMLDLVLGEGRALSEIGEDWGPLARVADPGDRARARRLALSVLRNLSRADRMLKPHLRKAPPLAVANALRLAVVEMKVEGTPAHAAVNGAVAVLRGGRRTEHAAGLANAVLRKAAEAEGWDSLPVPELPGWLRGRLMSAWGSKAVAAMERAHWQGAALDLTAKGDAADLAAVTGGAVLPTGSVRIPAGGQVSALPGYDEGAFWVQDAAAALPARLLGDVRGLSVADICAAPGGKTLQLAAMGARVTAVDVSEPRLARVAENLSRCGLSADRVAADALAWSPATPPDAILLDAPCSATGTIRRHPELPHIRGPEGLREVFALQAALIDRALGMLPPGGRLVFCTCSLLPEEGERQVIAALDRHPGLSAETPLPQGVPVAWRTAEGGLRTRPDLWPDGGLDGFYMAVLRKG